jgi:hypothetical protein
VAGSLNSLAGDKLSEGIAAADRQVTLPICRFSASR